MVTTKRKIVSHKAYERVQYQSKKKNRNSNLSYVLTVRFCSLEADSPSSSSARSLFLTSTFPDRVPTESNKNGNIDQAQYDFKFCCETSDAE